mmetsp:Transcript_22683/g.40748  ORF Transcript_22683/g.40748 Transcript_22683/m.40748 type:complete len:204 (+) Transcript_22683:512-1123(+)
MQCWPRIPDGKETASAQGQYSGSGTNLLLLLPRRRRPPRHRLSLRACEYCCCCSCHPLLSHSRPCHFPELLGPSSLTPLAHQMSLEGCLCLHSFPPALSHQSPVFSAIPAPSVRAHAPFLAHAHALWPSSFWPALSLAPSHAQPFVPPSVSYLAHRPCRFLAAWHVQMSLSTDSKFHTHLRIAQSPGPLPMSGCSYCPPRRHL